MTDHKLYALYIDLYENGSLKDIRDFSETERDAICMELEDLWMDQYLFEAHKSCFVVGLNHEEDTIYLIYKEGSQQRALPGDCLIREVTVGAPKVNQETLKLVGDRIPLRLPGYPARRLEVLFSDV